MTTSFRDRGYEQPARAIAAAFDQAHQRLRGSLQLLDAHTGDLPALHAAVGGILHLTRGLVDAVDRLIAMAPDTLTPADQEVTTDLVADLRALRGCLVTGAMLVDPAVTDLQRLTGQLLGEPPEAVLGKPARARSRNDPGERQPPAHDELARWQERITFPAVSDADPAGPLDESRL